MRIDGVEIGDMGLRLLQDGTQIPGMPRTRDRIITIPKRPGALDFGAEMEPLMIELSLAAIEDDAAAVQAVVEALKRALLDNGRPKTVMLELNVLPGKCYYVRYSGDMPIYRIAKLGRFTLPVTAYDPRIYALYWESRELSITTTGTLADLEIDGSIMPQTEIEIKLTTTNTNAVTVQIGVGGPLLTFTHATNFANNDVLIIDRDKYMATLNGANALPLLTAGDMEDFVFEAGEDHDLIVTLNAGTADVEARWRPRWQ